MNGSQPAMGADERFGDKIGYVLPNVGTDRKWLGEEIFHL